MISYKGVRRLNGNQVMFYLSGGLLVMLGIIYGAARIWIAVQKAKKMKKIVFEY